MNVILVSNRVASPQSDGPVEGGLASALVQAVKTSGAIWIGSSGRLSETTRKEPLASLEALGKGSLARIDLPAAHYQRYYEGFANSGLWPVLHSRPDLIQTDDDDYASYGYINGLMARALRPYLKPDTFIWVHDYHFLLMAQELRRVGDRSADRLLPAHAVPASVRLRQAAASSRAGASHAAIRPAGLPDPARSGEFRRLRPARAGARGHRWHRWSARPRPAWRHSRSASIPTCSPSRPPRRRRAPKYRGCAPACTAAGSRSAWTASTIPRGWKIVSAPSTGC